MGNILWLASYPKSGNTWLRAFLANLIVDGEQPLPLAELSRYCGDEALPGSYSQLAGRPHTELEPGGIAALRPQVHRQLAAASDRTIPVKTHNLAGSFDGYPLHEPSVTAGAVYVLRNPLDVVPSLADHFGLSLDEAIEFLNSADTATENNELFVGQVLGSWSQHVESWVSQAGPRVLVVRYEDLHGKADKTFGKVARLLGVRDKARIRRAQRAASFRELSSQEQADGFVERSDKAERFFRQGRPGGWRNVLSPAQIERVVAAHGPTMQRYKYLPT